MQPDPKAPLVNRVVLLSIELSGHMPNPDRYRNYLYCLPMAVLEKRVAELEREKQEIPQLKFQLAC